jgi:type II secretory pathway component PulJ
MKLIRSSRPRQGFMLMESILALSLFAVVGVALITALSEIGRLAYDARREGRLARILDSELRASMMVPILEEGETVTSLDEFKLELTTTVEPMLEMENQDGVALQQMFRIEVQASWYENNEWNELLVESWRYARLYQP